jgi:hypothetical protein
MALASDTYARFVFPIAWFDYTLTKHKRMKWHRMFTELMYVPHITPLLRELSLSLSHTHTHTKHARVSGRRHNRLKAKGFDIRHGYTRTSSRCHFLVARLSEQRSPFSPPLTSLTRENKDPVYRAPLINQTLYSDVFAPPFHNVIWVIKRQWNIK